MFSLIKKDWRSLERSKPGHRFQNRYEAAHRDGAKISTIGRLIRLCIALVAIVLGIIFAFIPGPAFVFFALAGALLATESRLLAKRLDWTEVKIRTIGRWAKRKWKAMGWSGRIAVVSTGALVSAGFTSLSVWYYFFR